MTALAGRLQTRPGPHVIDQNGALVTNLHGLGFGPTNLVLYISGLLNSNVPHGEPEAQSFCDRVLLFF